MSYPRWEGGLSGCLRTLPNHFLKSPVQIDCRSWRRRFVAAEEAPPEPRAFQMGSPVPAACQLGIIKFAGWVSLPRHECQREEISADVESLSCWTRWGHSWLCAWHLPAASA